MLWAASANYFKILEALTMCTRMHDVHSFNYFHVLAVGVIRSYWQSKRVEVIGS